MRGTPGSLSNAPWSEDTGDGGEGGLGGGCDGGGGGRGLVVCLFVGCLTSQQQASVSQGRICTDNFTCCHTEIEAADQTVYLTQSQYTDTGPTSPSADPKTPGAWQGSHWSANFLSQWYDSTPKKSRRQRDSNSGSSALEADALTTWPTRRSGLGGGCDGAGNGGGGGGLGGSGWRWCWW